MATLLSAFITAVLFSAGVSLNCELMENGCSNSFQSVYSDKLGFIFMFNMLILIPFFAFVYAMLQFRVFNPFAYAGFIFIFYVVVAVFGEHKYSDLAILLQGATHSLSFTLIFWWLCIRKIYHEVFVPCEKSESAIENLIDLIRAGELSITLKIWLRCLLRLPKAERREEIYQQLDVFRLRQAPNELRHALVLLLDDRVCHQLAKELD